MSNIARKRLAELVLGHDKGDGRLGPAVAEGMRAEMYRLVAGVVRETERVAKALAGTKLAAETRRDAAWAYRSLRELNGAVWQGRPGRAEAAVEEVSMDFLPEAECAAGRSANGPLRKDERVSARAPGGMGPLSRGLYLLGVYHTLYLVAAGKGDSARAQDLRVALRDTLAALADDAAARAAAFRKRDLAADADALDVDWAWVGDALSAIERAVLHEGPQERSLNALVEAGVVPVIRETTPHCEVPNPTGLWKKMVARHREEEDAKSDKIRADRAWEMLVNGFRPGAVEVILGRDASLQPSGHGAGLGMFEFNEFGHLHRAGSEPMVHIDTGEPVSKSHIPMRLVPDIAKAKPLHVVAGETLLAGATREMLYFGGRAAIAVHMSKSESREIRSAGGPPDGSQLVQWLDTGDAEWVVAEAEMSRREVFVYGPAEMETTLGTASFCFGEWIAFEDVEVREQENLFRVGDEVELSTPTLRHYGTAVIGCSIPRGDRTTKLPAECVGVVVRAPAGRATTQAEPMYDVQVGDVVLLRQKESDLRPTGKKKVRVKPRGMRSLARQSYNAFDSDAYRRYRGG